MNKAGSKHLTLSERIIIQQMLFDNRKLKEIADELSKDKRTIAKEIIKNRNAKENGRFIYGGKTKSAGCSSLSRFPYVCNGCKRKRAAHWSNSVTNMMHHRLKSSMKNFFINAGKG